ncbi:MAG TPA: vWA domain-containing protein, partial [Polyangiales bacterium]|nr:vWA domain-containing protein [Polyangiales bacterium]
MKNPLARLVPFALCSLLTATAVADSGNVEDILPLANDPNDPIGVERDPGLDRAAAAVSTKKPTGMTLEDRARFGPTPPPFAAKSGEALTAVATVHELTHRAALELSAGLALLEHELTLENSADKPAELEYRLAVPPDAALAGIDVCNARGCRSGQLAASGERAAAYDDAVLARGPRPALEQLPLASAFKLRDARGTALLIRAAPVIKDRPLTLRVRYATAAPLHGGVARLSLPARGMDPRAAALELSLRASDLLEVSAGGQSLRAGGPVLRSDPWQSLEIRAAAGSNAAGARSVWQFPCGAAQCARAYASAPPRAAAAVDLLLAVDASPSTEGVARSRLLTTIAAILARAPEGSRVRALRFASKAEPLLRERADPAALSLSAFAPVTYEAELGSATRFEAAWELMRSWHVTERGKLRRVIAIVGDGGITRGKARPFEAARRAGIEVSVVNVADRPTQPALASGAQSTGGTVIDAGSEADLAARSGSPERLEERVAALFAPVAVDRPSVANLKLPALRAGESLNVESVSRA